MMKKTISLALLCTVFSIVPMFDDAHAQSGNACFPKNRLPIFGIIEKSKTSVASKIEMVNTVCRELSESELHTKQSVLQRIQNGMAYVGGGLFGDAAAAFDDMDDSETQIAYKNTLRRIALIPDRMERIRLTYDHAVRHSGSYDHPTFGMKTIKRGYLFGAHTPGNLVGAAKENGTIGVCREYAALLYWSLLQVARHPSSKGRWDLGPNDFSVSSIPGVAGGPHVWIRVTLAEHDSIGRITGFVRFDLDSTWYATFTPLVPRRTGLSDQTRNAALRQCVAISDCLSGSKPFDPRDFVVDNERGR
jgi:hypothetical protein